MIVLLHYNDLTAVDTGSFAEEGSTCSEHIKYVE